MAWRKSPPELVAAFDAAFPDSPGAERRQMFGYPAGFVGGNMFGGLWQELVVVRVGPDAVAELLRVPGCARFEPMPGRPMKGYVTVPPALAGRRADLTAWLARGFEYASSLPPKAPKKSGARKPVASTKRPAAGKPKPPPGKGARKRR